MAKSVLIIALMLLFIFGVGAASNHYAQREQQSNSDTGSQQPSNTNNANTILNQQDRPSESTKQVDKNQARDSGALSKKDQYDLLLSLALLLVVAVQAFIAFWQVRIYDQQRKIMQRQVEHLAVIDRAYIEIVEMRMGALKVDEMVIVKTVFLNVGRSPAWNFRFKFTLIFLEKPQPLKPEWYKRPPPRHKGKVLPAGEKTENESPSNFIFSREQVNALVNGTAKLYAAGEVHYIDISGADQVSRSIRIYDPAIGVFKETDETENGETN